MWNVANEPMGGPPLGMGLPFHGPWKPACGSSASCTMMPTGTTGRGP